MSILGDILGKIFNKREARSTAAPAPSPAPASTAAPDQPIDVDGILDFMNDQREQKLNWRTSIVDLMKLTGMDSTLAERRELAGELGYTGDMSDTASMNVWLHKQVIQRIRDNGGQILDMTD